MQNDLSDTKILIDGYNIQLSQGTGIKTYSLTLASALANLNATVGILTSKPVKLPKSPILQSVLFSENIGASSLSSKKVIWFLSRQIGGFIPEIRQIGKKGYILNPPNNSWASEYEVYNYSHCFDLANNLYKRLSLISSFQSRNKINIFHVTYPLAIKLKGAKKITTIHDLIPLRLPYTTLDDKKFFFKNIKQSIKTSDLIFTVSESTKIDILSSFDIDPDKICVTYQPQLLKSLTLEELTFLETGYYYNQRKLNYKSYILFVGAIEPKKNVGRLIDSYAMLDTELPLVIAGKKAWLWEDQIKRINLLPQSKQEKIILLDHVSVDELRYLFAGAFCFVFPSLYEGFGVPVLEAMSFGCPVITSDISSLPEVGGEAALYVDPYNTFDIANAITKLINSPLLYQTMVENGYEQIKKFSQSSYEKRLLESYSKLL